jgi:hypothetical protein
MAGLMLFHGIGVQRDTSRGCYVLAKFMTDPIALLHFGVGFKDNGIAVKQAEIENVDNRSIIQKLSLIV